MHSQQENNTKKLLFAALGLLLFNFLTMPSLFYAGDNYVSRIEAANLIETGSLGIPYSRRAELSKHLISRGQNFYENDTKEMYFSKFGIGFTFSYAALYYLIQAAGIDIDIHYAVSPTRGQLLVINIIQLFFSLGVMLYLYLTASLYTKNLFRRGIFVIFSVYGTFLWHYLRAPTHEIFIILLFAGFLFHSLYFLRYIPPAADGLNSGENKKHLYAAGVYTAVLLLFKSSYATLIPALIFCAAVPGYRAGSNIFSAARSLKKYILPLAVPFAISFLIISFTNALRFESPWNSGYGQWVNPEGFSRAFFSLKYIPVSLSAFLIKGGNSNIFLFYPVLFFSLPGFKKFFSEHKKETLFISLVIIPYFLLISAFSYWHAEWCYGPRHLVAILIPAGIPFISFLNISAYRKYWSLTKNLLIAAVFGFSFILQFYVNSMNYFAYYRVKYFFSLFKNDRIDSYIDERASLHRGLLYIDLAMYRDFNSDFFPIDTLKELYSAHNDAESMDKIEKLLADYIKLNFFLLDR